METQYKLEVVPHLMDPNGEPVKLLNVIGGVIAERFTSDISAKIEFSGAHDYMFEFFLLEQRAGVYLTISRAQIRDSISKSTMFEKLANWFVEHLQKEIEKMPNQDWSISKAWTIILGIPIAGNNVVIPIFDLNGGLWEVEFTPKEGEWEFVRVK